MPGTTTDLRRVLRFLLHLGLVELRELGYGGGAHAQIADLADALEFLPEFLSENRDPDLEVIREQFQGYAARYPESRYDYLGYLDGKSLPAPY